MSLRDRGTIDHLVEQTDGSVLLVLSEFDPWGGYPEQLGLLRDKLEVYAEFILSGQLYQQVPSAEGQPNGLMINCIDEPWGDYVELIHAFAAAVGPHLASISLEQVPPEAFDEA